MRPLELAKYQKYTPYAIIVVDSDLLERLLYPVYNHLLSKNIIAMNIGGNRKIYVSRWHLRLKQTDGSGLAGSLSEQDRYQNGWRIFILRCVGG
jgi:hypothetical protein